MKRLKILHMIFSLNVGGSECMLVDIINRQILEYDVFLCIINNAYDVNLLNKISKKVNVIFLNRKESSHNILDVFRLNYHVFTTMPDILHCHDSNIIEYIFIRKYYKTLLTVHATFLPLVGINKYNELVAISNAVGTEIQKKGISRYSVIYNGIDVYKINKRKNTNRKKNFHIVQVGRLEHLIKGQHLMLQAIAQIKHNNPSLNIKIDFIGNGSSYEYLKNIVKNFAIEQYVSFLGSKDREYIYSHLKDYDLLVQPSISEGFGLTIVESMVAGIPVLVSDVEGPMEIIKNGLYGYAFQTSNIADLVNKITYIQNYYSDACSMAAKAKAYAINNFDLSILFGKYDELYKRM